MRSHGPNCLAGPVSRKRSCWRRSTRRHANAPLRQELVERVRREIAEGTYETPEKWDLTLDRLFDHLRSP
jgi:hypothetical protein